MLALERTRNGDGLATEDRWPAPLDQDWLERFLTDIFETHWQGLCFGPILEGAAYELHPPGKPEKITVRDGYLTVFYGRLGHFHLCIGRNEGAVQQGGEALVARRRPGKAEFFRSLDPEGHPRSWGFRMENGAGEPALHLVFPNPFIPPMIAWPKPPIGHGWPPGTMSAAAISVWPTGRPTGLARAIGHEARDCPCRGGAVPCLCRGGLRRRRDAAAHRLDLALRRSLGAVSGRQ